MSPRPDVTEERTQQILDAAMVVFAQSGFHNARMDDIAEEAGVSKGTLYWYFDSKDDIILGILDRLFDVELDDLQAMLQADGSAYERLLTFAQYFVEEAQKMSELLPIAYEFYAVASRREPVQEFFRTYFSAYRDGLIALIRQGIERGELREDTEPDDVALTIMAFFEGIMLLWVTDAAAIDLEAQVSASMELLLDNIRRE